MLNNDNTSKIEMQGVIPRNIGKEEIVKMVVQGDSYVDVMKAEKPTGATIKKLDKDHYCILRTGEIKEFQKDKTKDKSKDDLRKTFNRLRQLIRTNFVKDGSNQLFITLTYAENMTDEKRLYNDFDKFFKKLKYKFKGHKLDYIAVMEPQERGAWHVHLMLKSNQSILYIDNKELAKIWGFGYTDTQRLKSDDVGSYYVAYFTDILAESKNAKSEKKRKKGARLSMYPKGFKFYRTSRGIKKPDEITAEYGKLENLGYKKTYETAFKLIDKANETYPKELNTIQKEVWKRVLD